MTHLHMTYLWLRYRSGVPETYLNIESFLYCESRKYLYTFFMQRLSFFILFSLLSYSTVSAFVMPFSDVSDTTEYAASLNALMANGNILDDGNGKFS